jgi:signal transduction histidine kinase/CheY-like chemotaxis protein
MYALKRALPETTARPVNEAIRAEQVRMLYANVPVSQAVALVNGAVLAGVQTVVIERAVAFSWLAFLVGVTLARLYLAARFTRAAPKAADMSRWLDYFGASALASGAAWGSAAWFLFPQDSVVHQVFMAFVVGGMVAGAVSLLTPVFPVFLGFALFALLPAIVRFLWTGDYMHYAMGGMAALFLLAMLVTGKRIHNTILQALLLRFENHDLIVDLTSARARLQAVNADLLATQQTLRTLNEELEGRVAERTAALERADRHKDEFLAMLSHELRSPLAAICTSSFLLGKVDAGSQHVERARQVIERQALYLSRLVDDLLDVTRIARGKITIRRERVDLAACVRRAADDQAQLFGKLGVRLSVDAPASAAFASVDPIRIAQLIGNLLQNSAKFTPAGGQVELSLHVSNDWAELQVSDDGAGIDPAILPELFQPFVQGNRTGARIDGGLGLGLALVKGIAELHGGSVQAQSNGPGQGATFTVRLPLALREVSQEGPGSSIHGAVPNRFVLVVDDNRDAADTLALLVGTFGHATQVAYDGPSAIRIARGHPPDVVLCDLGMPGMSGYEVARTLRSQYKDIRLIAVTGYTRPQDAAEATAAGFDAYVTKPPPPGTIKALLS